MNYKTKARLCAEFLVKCIEAGWAKKDLDQLEQIWWKGRAWKHTKEYKAMRAKAGIE